MKHLLLLTVALLSLSMAAAAVNVTVTTPTNGSQVGSPFTLQANASSPHQIVGWHIYLDGNDVFSAGVTNSITASINGSVGTHQVVTRAWDSTGAYGSYTENITISSGGGGGSGVTVTVTAPGNGSQVGSPFTLSANASSQHQIVGWHVYLDGQNVYTAGATNSISTSLNANSGNHQLVVRAWDSTGAYGDSTINITVSGGGGGGGGGNGLPTPPPGAIVFSNIDDRGNWSTCHNPSCSGGNGEGTYWMAQNQGSPSRDGASTEFYNSGTWSNSLWTQKLGANNSVHNFLWDFWFYVDSQANDYGQALEFDTFQFVNGYNYMIGSQCDYGQHKWDTWDEASGHWIPTSLACPNFSTNTWHHIQWYVTTNTTNHTYTYVTLVVDGTGHSINYTGHALNNGWSNNLGVQWQLDDNANGGGYTEWIDSAKLTIW